MNRPVWRSWQRLAITCLLHDLVVGVNGAPENAVIDEADEVAARHLDDLPGGAQLGDQGHAGVVLLLGAGRRCKGSGRVSNVNLTTVRSCLIVRRSWPGSLGGPFGDLEGALYREFDDPLGAGFS